MPAIKPTAPKAAGQQRAERPRPPALGPAALQAQDEHRSYLREREALERRSVLRGLILLAILALVFSLFHADASRAFPAGWWRVW